MWVHYDSFPFSNCNHVASHCGNPTSRQVHFVEPYATDRWIAVLVQNSVPLCGNLYLWCDHTHEFQCNHTAHALSGPVYTSDQWMHIALQALLAAFFLIELIVSQLEVTLPIKLWCQVTQLPSMNSLYSKMNTLLDNFNILQAGRQFTKEFKMTGVLIYIASTVLHILLNNN